jgi:NAD(P)-dependent dehydrogenase (short-subunit alcohol dehydrogenase family)
MAHVMDFFSLSERVAIITGGGGLLGKRHAEAIMEAGGTAILWDIQPEIQEIAAQLATQTQGACSGQCVDITQPSSIETALHETLGRHEHVDILINNAANDPKVSGDQGAAWSRFEHFDLELWSRDLAVGLTGAFLCSQHIGRHMAAKGGGVILNIASDLGVIAPDQRIYREHGLPMDQQPAKPVTYSVIKHGLIGLTRYLATYWAEDNVRVNALSPGGIYTGQPDDFVQRLTNLIPLGRMAGADEYKAAVLFMVSEASSYMTGANVVIDGGRTCW